MGKLWIWANTVRSFKASVAAAFEYLWHRFDHVKRIIVINNNSNHNILLQYLIMILMNIIIRIGLRIQTIIRVRVRITTTVTSNNSNNNTIPTRRLT